MYYKFDLKTFDLGKFDSILARGLCEGKGSPEGQMCIEAAICNVLGLPHDDNPQCVCRAALTFQIGLNDSKWSSSEARAKGLRSLGLAQLESENIVSGSDFIFHMLKGIIQKFIPEYLRETYPTLKNVLEAASVCELTDDMTALQDALKDVNNVIPGIDSIISECVYLNNMIPSIYDTSSKAVRMVDVGRMAMASQLTPTDKYLELMAKIALDVLIELKSPGVALLNLKNA